MTHPPWLHNKGNVFRLRPTLAANHSLVVTVAMNKLFKSFDVFRETIECSGNVVTMVAEIIRTAVEMKKKSYCFPFVDTFSSYKVIIVLQSYIMTSVVSQ